MPRVDQRRRLSEPENVNGATRRERLAINLLDVTDERRLPEFVRQCMRLHELLRAEPILIDRERFDEVGVEFSCDLLRAACLCDVIRAKNKNAGVYPTRLYLFRQRAWSKLPGDASLVVTHGDTAELNTQWFAPLLEDIAPLPFKKVTF